MIQPARRGRSVAGLVALAFLVGRPPAVPAQIPVPRDSAVVDASDSDPRDLGARRFLGAVAGNPRLRGIVLQTVGRKDHDGMAVVVVADEEEYDE